MGPLQLKEDRKGTEEHERQIQDPGIVELCAQGVGCLFDCRFVRVFGAQTIGVGNHGVRLRGREVAEDELGERKKAPRWG